MSQVASMYYEKGINQQEIAHKFNVSKITVSRMLQKAKELRIVQTTITLPFQLNVKLQNQIEKEYGLKKTIVVKHPSSEVTNIRRLIGRTWAFYMNLSLSDNLVLGMGVGNTIGQTVGHLVPMRTENVRIVQLMGGLADVAEENPFTIIQETCRKLGTKGTYFTSFAAVENKQVRDSIIYNSPMGRQIRDLWKRCKQALFGIGAIEKGTLLSPKLVSIEELREFKQLGVVGDILGHCFDRNGNFINTDLEERLVSIPISMLKDIQERVAIAGGEYKAQAIQGALRSGVITTLITDEIAAKKLL